MYTLFKTSIFLHPQITILDYSVKEKIFTRAFNELDDFSKLIGFSGGKAIEIIPFNSKQLIAETIDIPDSTYYNYHRSNNGCG